MISEKMMGYTHKCFLSCSFQHSLKVSCQRLLAFREVLSYRFAVVMFRSKVLR